jgi:hypothetical protein
MAAAMVTQKHSPLPRLPTTTTSCDHLKGDTLPDGILKSVASGLVFDDKIMLCDEDNEARRTGLQPVMTNSFQTQDDDQVHHSFLTHHKSSLPWQHPAFQAFAKGQSPLACLPNAFEATRINAWKQDVLALKALSFGATAGVANDGGKEIRTGVHQIWLQCPSSSSSSTSTSTNFLVGNLDARRDLQGVVEDLRNKLVYQQRGGVDSTDKLVWNLPANLIELSYLSYDGRSGARYAKHVDTFRESTSWKTKDYKRCVSFLIYLGEGKEANENELWHENLEEDECDSNFTSHTSTSRPWDCHRDGGALRIHGNACSFAADMQLSTEKSSENWCDIVPEAGTLVLFDSATVEHEVMPTFRDRLCIVGWFNTPV